MSAYTSLYQKFGTQFDLVPPHLINLRIGSLSDELLKGCAQDLKTGAAHRMVSSPKDMQARLASLYLLLYIIGPRGFLQAFSIWP